MERKTKIRFLIAFICFYVILFAVMFFMSNNIKTSEYRSGKYFYEINMVNLKQCNNYYIEEVN